MQKVLNSKNIFSKKNQKVLKNKVTDIVVEENGFSATQNYQMFSINLDYQRNKSGNLINFGQSEKYSDISFTKEPNAANYFVNFNFETDLDERLFMLRNAKATISLIGEQYNPNGQDDDDNGTVDDNEANDSYSFTNTYDSEVGSDLYFSVLRKAEDFKQNGIYATVGILRTSTNKARVYVSVAYYSESGNTKTNYTRAEIYVYADEQQVSTIGEDGNLLNISGNEIVNEETYFVPEQNATRSYSLRSNSPTWMVKIRQLAEYYSGHFHYYCVNDSQTKLSYISRAISDEYISFEIANFFQNTGIDFSAENIIKLQDCRIEYNGNLIMAHLKETQNSSGDGNSVHVIVYIDDVDPLVSDWNDFSYGEKNFYLGYFESGSEPETPDTPTEPSDPTEVTKISTTIINRVLDEWANGKETAVIRCSVPSNLSVYQIGDEVIPMVYGEDGKDRPMSLYKDGTKKVFRVVGTKFIYDGAVWQELTLQEVTNG